MGIGIFAGTVEIQMSCIGDITDEEIVSIFGQALKLGTLLWCPLSGESPRLLVGTLFDHLRFDTDLFHQLFNIGTLHDYTNGAYDRTGVGDDLLGMDGGVVAAACHNAAGVGDDRFLTGELFDGIGDLDGGRYSATR